MQFFHKKNISIWIPFLPLNHAMLTNNIIWQLNLCPKDTRFPPNFQPSSRAIRNRKRIPIKAILTFPSGISTQSPFHVAHVGCSHFRRHHNHISTFILCCKNPTIKSSPYFIIPWSLLMQRIPTNSTLSSRLITLMNSSTIHLIIIIVHWRL